MVLLTMLQPVYHLEGSRLSEVFSPYISTQSHLTAMTLNTDSLMKDIIESECSAYIQDKATSLGLDITVSVDLNEDDIPGPAYVRISGQASPYGRAMLQQIIASELGVGKEGQEWISEP